MGEREVRTLVLVDTDILIDVGRGDPNAVAYLEDLESQNSVGISVVTQMELLVGCANKREQRAVERFIRRFTIFSLSEAISDEAVFLLQKYKLSHGLLIADALIAATTIVQGASLASKNQKDYRFIADLALLPYPSM
jgi:predicted nucleic acid-binding protein